MIGRRIAILLPLLLAAVAWRMLPSGMRADALGGLRRGVAAMAARVAFWLWRETDLGDPREGDAGAAGFDWRTHPADAATFTSELEAAGVWPHEAGPPPEGHQAIVTEKLQAAGIHLDQEGSPDLRPPTPAVRYVGTTTPQRLVDALSERLSRGHAGLIVDTTVGGVIEVDEHPSVGAGLLILLDETGTHLLRSGTNRQLLQAIRMAAERSMTEQSGDVLHALDAR